MKDYDVVEFPKSRLATFDVGKIGSRKHQITGLLEVDVTAAKEKIRTLLKDGREIGFISWILKCTAETAAEDPSVQAINKGRNKQVVFKDVDISFPLERTVAGKKVPLAALVKKAHQKSVDEIHAEITTLRGQRVDSEADFVLGDTQDGWKNRLFFNMPGWMRMIFWKTLLKNPAARKDAMGTIIVTNTGMSGSVSGWIIPKTMHNLAVCLGSINKRPWVVDGKICIRDIMHLSVIFDHDVIDGAPAARFSSRLVKHLEKADFLD